MESLPATPQQDQQGDDLTECALIGGLLASVAVAILPEMFSIVAHVETMLFALAQSAMHAATLK
jgi:hypothetical protein